MRFELCLLESDSREQPQNAPVGSGKPENSGIHIKTGDRCASGRSPTDHLCPIGAPAEVFFPSIRARVEKLHFSLGAGISRSRPVTFSNVAMRASEA